MILSYDIYRLAVALRSNNKVPKAVSFVQRPLHRIVISSALCPHIDVQVVNARRCCKSVWFLLANTPPRCQPLCLRFIILIYL